MPDEQGTEKYVRESYIAYLEEKIGTPYKLLDCTLLPLYAASQLYKSLYGSELGNKSRSLFVNGGALLENFAPGRVNVCSKDELARQKLKDGDLILKIRKVSNYFELKSAYSKGDKAIFQKNGGEAFVVSDIADAKKLLNDKNGAVYLTQHYFSVLKKEDGPKIIHASRKSKKTIIEPLSDYINSKYNNDFKYVPIPFNELFFSLSAKNLFQEKEKKETRERLAQNP